MKNKEVVHELVALAEKLATSAKEKATREKAKLIKQITSKIVGMIVEELNENELKLTGGKPALVVYIDEYLWNSTSP